MKPDVPGRGVRRPEIDGLRGLSALLVIAFHLWFSGLSGGVDMLFVVSGYFLIRGILRDRDDPRIRPGAIWAGFARRLFPQLLVFLLAATAAIFVFIDPAHRAAELRHVAFSAIFAENYHLTWLRAAPPEDAAHQAMVEHLWALSVVGQIYILAPCVMAIVEALRRRWRLSARRTYPALLAAITLASLVYALIAVNRSADVAYYVLPARVWQFSAGGLIAALALGEREGPRPLAVAASWLGVLAAVSTGATFGASGAFPGAAALWPVSAAALVLVFARSSDRLNAGRILGLNVFRRLGRDSYGLYMWHWPLAVLALNQTGWEPLSWGVGGAIFAASWALAIAGRKCGEYLMDLLPAGGAELAQRLYLAFALLGLAATLSYLQ